jgi:hypothetical protein
VAATSTTETWDAAWTLTMRAHRKRLTDQIFDEYPLLSMLLRAGNVEVESGGKEVKEDLMYGKNSGQYFSDYDSLNTDGVDGITMANAPFRYLAVPITISMTEEMENKKRDAAQSLLAAKTEQSMLTSRDTTNNAFFAATTGKQPLGLQDLIADAPSSGTVMGINRANESWWRNQNDATSTNFNNKTDDVYDGPALWSTVYNNASSGNDTPSHIFTTLTLFGEYENILESTGYARVVGGAGGRTGLDAGTPFFRKAGVFSDRDCASQHAYMINKRYMKLKVMSGLNFAKTPFKEPHNQLAKVAFVVFGHQLIVNNARRHGVTSVLT